MRQFIFTFVFLFIQSIYAEAEDLNEVQPPVNVTLYKTRKPIKKQYIVVFKDVGARNTESFFRDYDEGQNIKQVYNELLDGYAATIEPEALQNLLQDPRVEFVEEDQIFSITDCDRQSNARSWHLSRVSSSQWTGTSRYTFKQDSGSGVTAYVIDTGINPTHVDFEGRAIAAASFVPGEPNVDTNGHGTCVAGVIAGREFGISKSTRIIALKVFGARGEGSTSGILSALNWALNHHNQNPGQKSIINMSLGGGFSYALNNLADRCAQAGIPVIVAAGNEGEDACNVSPASASSVLTVGATDYQDTLTSFSNYGQCVNILAPGDQINCPWIGSSTAIRRGISGTSFSSPCVAGYGAALLSTGDYSPASLYQKIISDSLKGVVQVTQPSTVNRLLHSTCP